MKILRVLFVGGAKRYSFAEKLVQVGREFDLDIKLYAYEMGEGLPIADIATVVQGRKFSSSDVLCHLGSTIDKYGIDIALPFHDQAIPLLINFADQVYVPTCDRALVNIFSSKIQSSKFFKKHGILSPPFSGKVPAIAKPDKGSASQGLLRFYEQSELVNFLNNTDSQSYEVQGLLSGPEYSVDCFVCLNSEFKYYAMRERLEVLGGEVVRSITVNVPKIANLCDQIIEIPGISGAMTMQFIYDKIANSYSLMEVNPRFGGGVLASWAAGAPWFHILLRDYLGMSQEPSDYRSGVLMARSFREHFFNL